MSKEKERPKIYIANIKDCDLLRAQYLEVFNNYTNMLTKATSEEFRERIQANLDEIREDIKNIKAIRKEFEQGIRPEQEELKSIKYGKNHLQAMQTRTPNEAGVAEYVADPEGRGVKSHDRLVLNTGARKHRISRSKAPSDREEYEYLEKASSKDSQMQAQARDYQPEIRYDENGKRISQIRFADTRILEDQKQFIDESHEGVAIEPTAGVNTYVETKPTEMKVSKFYTHDQKQNYYQLLKANLGEDHPALTSLNNRAKAELSNIEVTDESPQGINNAIEQALEKYTHVPKVRRGLEELQHVASISNIGLLKDALGQEKFDALNIKPVQIKKINNLDAATNVEELKGIIDRKAETELTDNYKLLLTNISAAIDEKIATPPAPKKTNSQLLSSYIKITEEQHLSDEEFKKRVKDYIKENEIPNEIVIDVLKVKQRPILAKIAQEAFKDIYPQKKEPSPEVSTDEKTLNSNEQKLFDKISDSIVKHQDDSKHIKSQTLKAQIVNLGISDKGAIKVLNKLSVEHGKILEKENNKITKDSLTSERKRLQDSIKENSRILSQPVTTSIKKTSVESSSFKPDSSPPATNKSNKGIRRM